MRQLSALSENEEKLSELVSLKNDIDEIDAIFWDSKHLGVFQRDRAIGKIRELQLRYPELLVASALAAAGNWVPFNAATNKQIAEELQRLRELLYAQYILKLNRQSSDKCAL